MNVLTYPNEYYHENFKRRSTLVDEYKLNMMTYLTKMYPDKSPTELKAKLDKIVAKSYKAKNVQYLEMESPGNIAVKSDILLDKTNFIDHGIITPYGAVYVPTTERVSMFTSYIKDNQAERKKVKREELIAEAQGDLATKQFKALRQMNIKININVLSGVMLSSVSFKSSINYNAITATARFGIMSAYAIAEMMLEGNCFFSSEDRALNWITNLLRVYPGDNHIRACIAKYSLHQPTHLEVYEAYVEQLHQYVKAESFPNIFQLIHNLSDTEATFIYYAMNLARIFRTNDSFKSRCATIIDIDTIPNVTGDIPTLLELPDEVVRTMAVIFASDEIPDKCTIEDISKSMPDLNRRVYSIYHHIDKQFADLELLFKTFIFLPIMPAEISSHKNMIRKTVLLSDTDSILFTEVHWVKWFTGDIKLSTPSIRINATICSLISKILEFTLGYNSASMGIDVSNIKLIALKNEFMYDVFMRTPISKHYAGYIRYREGMKLSPCKLDLKGKNFRGSDLPATTTRFVKKFIKDTFDDFLVTYKLHPEDFIKKVIRFEQRIKASVLRGEATFLGQKPINLPDSYANPEQSNYMYYKLWTEVFSEKYGLLNLPQKCKEAFILTVSYKNLAALENMKVLDKQLYSKFVTFLNKYPKREFSRVMVPIDLPIPIELISISDYKKVIKTNCYSLELVLKSFNIVNYPTKHGINLFSDTYSEILEEVLLEAPNDDGNIPTQTDYEEDYEEDDDDWLYEEDDEYGDSSEDGDQGEW